MLPVAPATAADLAAASATVFRFARPRSKSPPTILSISMTRWNSLPTKPLCPSMAHVTLVPLATASRPKVTLLVAAKGLMNKGLLALGLIDEPIRLLYTPYAVLIGMVYVLLPFMVLPLYSSIEKLDFRLVEAAADLGAGPARRFVNVILPLTLPGIIAGSLLVFMPALGMFFITDVLGGARDLLVGNILKDQFLDARDWPFGAAASMVMIGLLCLFLGVYAFSLRRLASED